MNGKLLLLIEDSKKVQNYNRLMLTDEGFTVETAMTLADARAFLSQKQPDAVILDIGMPDGSGLDFLREFRETSKIPVLLLTGFGEAKDIVEGFKTGCDDYLPKPYTFEVLLMRLKRLIKGAERVPETIARGGLTLKPVSSEAYVNGSNLDLSPKEYDLLQFLIQNETRQMSAEFIYESVWGRPMAGDSNAIKKALSSLRKKLTGSGYTIFNEYGSGYCFQRGEPESKKT